MPEYMENIKHPVINTEPGLNSWYRDGIVDYAFLYNYYLDNPLSKGLIKQTS